MNEQPEILSFVKAMASADRLRIVGLLSQGSKRAAQMAEALGMHPSEVMRHLEQLTSSGVVS
jgi:DNA-binding transcriptional ArsR family regulator